MTRVRWRGWAVGALTISLVALDRFAYRYLDVLSNGRHEMPLITFTEEVTAALAGGLLLIPLLFYARRVRRPGVSVLQLVLRHAPMVPVFSGLHTTLNYAFRLIAWRALGLGSYNYGIMSIRYWMEFPMDVLVYAIFVGVLYFLDHVREARERDVTLARLEGEVSQLRLQALEAQLQPHFLFNALNTISSVMYDDPAAADTMIARLAELLRRTLRRDVGAENTLGDEMETLDLYFAIMRARFADRLAVRLDVPEETRPALLPTLLLQPIVENALRHGDPGSDRTAEIAIRARRENGRLVLAVEDNGPGLPGQPAAAMGNGVGLSNCARRLSELYGDAQRLTLANRAGGGLAVTVELPFHASSTT